ncbi:MAG: hypothetical protein F6K30_15640 [Cyanothece sp. SIO2G6]|nr:hypothetical protein [Cyanothece sp. SIO2G6]
MVQVETAGKAKILADFQQLLGDRTRTESRVTTREEEAKQEQNQQVLATVSQYTTDQIVRGLTDLQLEFSDTVTSLSDRLSTETTKLDELQQAIAIETQNLQDLRQTRIVADALYILNQEHQEKLRLLEERATREQEHLEREMTATRKAWQQELDEFNTTVAEREAILDQARQRQEADYDYETGRSRTIANDEYEAAQRQAEREIQTTTEAKEKDWTEREAVLVANQATLAEYRQKVEAFPTELDEAIKQAREEGIRDAHQDSKVKADLLAKEWEGIKQGYDLQIQALNAKIQQQAEQISEISTQLQAALRQAQELAMRAFESSSNRMTTTQGQ